MMRSVLDALRAVRSFYAIPALAVLYIAIAVPRFQYPELTHGDEYQDAMTMITGINYAKFGFLRMRFLPQLDLQQAQPRDLYTHYPPLPFIINGALRMMSGFDTLKPYRLMALCLSFLTLVFWYLFAARIAGSWRVGFLAALFYLTNPFFIYGMDSISEFMYSDVILTAALCLAARMMFDPSARLRRRHAVMWILLFILSWITFEYMVFLTLFFVLCRCLRGAKGYPSWKAVILYTSAPAAGFAAHLLQNAWYFGGLGAAAGDLVSSAAYRFGASAESAVNFPTWWHHVLLRHISLAFVFPFFLLAVGVFMTYLAYPPLSAEQKKRVRILLEFFMVLFLCGLTWYVCFPSHSYAHAYVHFLVRHLVPASALGFTAAALVFRYRCSGASGAAGKALWCLVVAGICAWGVLSSGLPVTSGAVKREKDFLLFRDSLYRLRDASAPGDVVGLNYHRYPFISYYANRYCVRYYDMASLTAQRSALEGQVSQGAAQRSALEGQVSQGAAQRSALDSPISQGAAQTTLPRYFIFFPYANPASAQLLAFLQEKYELLYTSPSVRYPALFFRLKAEAAPA